jgi:4-hydroxyphenylpyruvate dioxygenase
MIDADPTALAGISFVEFASDDADALHTLFTELAFSRTMGHAARHVDLYEQGSIVFLLNRSDTGHAGGFRREHGTSIVSMGWTTLLVPSDAAQVAIERGAIAAEGDHHWRGHRLAAVQGIGDSLIYFTPADERPYADLGFVPLERPDRVTPKGFRAIDHLTNNVARGTLQRWADFYTQVFGFSEVSYFDIRGAKTGLVSSALRCSGASSVTSSGAATSRASRRRPEHRP